MSVTPLVSHVDICPYVVVAVASLSHQAITAVRRLTVSVIWIVVSFLSVANACILLCNVSTLASSGNTLGNTMPANNVEMKSKENMSARREQHAFLRGFKIAHGIQLYSWVFALVLCLFERKIRFWC